MKIKLCIVLYLLYEAQCEEKILKSKNPLPYFRRQLEEVSDDLSIQSNVTDDSPSNLVSVLIKNVKQIYSELDESNTMTSATLTTTTIKTTSSTSTPNDIVIFDFTTYENMVDDFITKLQNGYSTTYRDNTDNIISKPNDENNIDLDTNSLQSETVTIISNNTKKLNEFDSGSVEITKEEELLPSYKNATLVPFSDKELINMDISTIAYGLVEKEELMHLSKNLLLFETDQQDQKQKDLSLLNATVVEIGYSEKLRSCIFCNNVDMENCNDPKNRLIPSTVCEHDDDLCYSLHTPFGVIDRGCYNVNNNLTTYVCSCNLCNYISISEMPYIFSKKQDWIDNVIELAHVKNFRQSVMKEMSCLKCEANSSLKNADITETSNCLQGSIGSLATEFCEYNEVCAVKAIRREGYIWRGCVKFPLFNYWWSLCDSDLCNYDIVASIYDSV